MLSLLQIHSLPSLKQEQIEVFYKDNPIKFVQKTADLKQQKKEESGPINCELLSKSTMRVTQTEHRVAVLSPVCVF